MPRDGYLILLDKIFIKPWLPHLATKVAWTEAKFSLILTNIEY